MGGITLAWLIGESIIIARQITRDKHPPVPGTLLASSGFFALCAIIAEYGPARPAATLLAFGIDIAAWLQMPYITPPSTSPGGGAKPAGPAGGGILPTPTGQPIPGTLA